MIRFYHLLAFSVLFPLCASAQYREGAKPGSPCVSMEECLDMARENYPQIRKFGLIDATEKYDLSIASSTWIPQFSVSGKATWQSDVVEMPFEIPGFELDMPHDQYSLSANVTQHIWDGGVSSSQREAVKTAAEVQRGQTEVSLYSIRSRVQNVYLGILLLDEQISQNRLLMESLQRNAAEVQVMIDNGMAYRSDLDMINVNILDCMQQTDALNADREAYVKILTLLTGQDMSGKELEVPSDAEAVDVRSVSRPEMALYDARLRQNDAQIKQLNAKISPQFDLTLQGGLGRPGLNMLKNDFAPMFIAGIKMQWNIASLYTRKSDKRKIESARQDIELERETFLFNTGLDATQQQTEVDKARMMLDKDDEIIRLRSSIRLAGEEQYRNGTIKMTDLMDMIDDEHNARLARSVHHIQLLMAIYDLKDTVGQ